MSFIVKYLLYRPLLEIQSIFYLISGGWIMPKDQHEFIKWEFRNKGMEITDEEADEATRRVVEFFKLLDKWHREKNKDDKS